jgi:hypothetical protein
MSGTPGAAASATGDGRAALPAGRPARLSARPKQPARGGATASVGRRQRYHRVDLVVWFGGRRRSDQPGALTVQVGPAGIVDRD